MGHNGCDGRWLLASENAALHQDKTERLVKDLKSQLPSPQHSPRNRLENSYEETFEAKFSGCKVSGQRYCVPVPKEDPGSSFEAGLER